MTEPLVRTPFDDIIQSDLFTFYVGEEKKPFLVHSKAVGATSQVFDRLVDGGMKEAQSRSAELRDTDPETFIRFLEYAYRHEYTDPLWTSIQDTSSNENGTKYSDNLETRHLDQDSTQQETEAGALFHEVGFWANSRSAPSGFGAVHVNYFGTTPNTSTVTTPMKTDKVKKCPSGSRAAFESRQYTCSSYSVTTPPRDLDLTPPARACGSIFLAHARMYTIADMWMVSPLKELALHKLHRALVRFQLHPERLGDVVELARYAYGHGEDRSEDGRIDAMRDLVVNYVVCEMKALGKHAEFRDLMDGGGEFAGDFWDIVQKRD